MGQVRDGRENRVVDIGLDRCRTGSKRSQQPVQPLVQHA
jgi:hypothetical protein